MKLAFERATYQKVAIKIIHKRKFAADVLPGAVSVSACCGLEWGAWGRGWFVPLTVRVLLKFPALLHASSRCPSDGMFRPSASKQAKPFTEETEVEILKKIDHVSLFLRGPVPPSPRGDWEALVTVPTW